MLIKSADDRAEDIAKLNALLAWASPAQKIRIEEELRNLEKGAWGEEQAAYHLDFHFSSYKNTIILHDLRLELSNKVAQIDHLIVNRFLDVYILESKNLHQLTVDEAGNCTTTKKGQVIGVKSPIEQCKAHAVVLKRVFELDPRLKFMAPRRSINCRVLLATRCNLNAPYHKEFYLKADSFHSAWEKDIDNESLIKSVLSAARMVSRETLIKIGEVLKELHNPSRRDWRARFGIAEAIPANGPREVVASVPGLAAHVHEYGNNWFILERTITTDEKRAINAAGYFGNKEKGKWVWRLRG